VGVLTKHSSELTMYSEHTSNMYKHLRKQDNKYSNGKSFILTATYTWHKCSKRYARDIYTVTTMHLCNHSNKACIVTYKISNIKHLWPGGDSLLHVTIFCKSLASQVLLKRSRNGQHWLQDHNCWKGGP
jgi:hypothetical protein